MLYLNIYDSQRDIRHQKASNLGFLLNNIQGGLYIKKISYFHVRFVISGTALLIILPLYFMCKICVNLLERITFDSPIL